MTLNLSSNIAGDSNDKNNFSHKSLSTNTQASKLRKAFENNFSANIKLSKTQLHKVVQSGGFLGRPIGPLLKIGLLLIGNILNPLVKSVLISLGLMAAASALDEAIRKKMIGSGFTTVIVSNEEMNDFMKIVKSLEKSELLIKVIHKTIKNEAKEQRKGFLGMLLETLGASLLGEFFNRERYFNTIRGGERTSRASENL